MSLTPVSAAEALQRLDDFSVVIDARSPGEFALDHLPGALNWPSLDDAERASIGTEYKQVSPFAARKRGAMLVARNVAMHIERHVLELPKDWQPLVYCWRGGHRSGALGLVLGQIGFRVRLLEGGYQSFRRAVIESLERLPATLDLRVVCGPTGSGKSLLLGALAAAGAQVLDLEGLADHRGSVLGLVPGRPQPTQKAFDTRLWNALRTIDPSRPVFVESESAKVGDLRVPAALVERMRSASCVWVDLPIEGRVALLMREYDFFVRDVEAFCQRLDALLVMRGKKVIERWQGMARAGQFEAVVLELLVAHYDPLYRQSMRRNFSGLDDVQVPRLAWDGSEASLTGVAAALAADSEPVRP